MRACVRARAFFSECVRACVRFMLNFVRARVHACVRVENYCAQTLPACVCAKLCARSKIWTHLLVTRFLQQFRKSIAKSPNSCEIRASWYSVSILLRENRLKCHFGDLTDLQRVESKSKKGQYWFAIL